MIKQEIKEIVELIDQNKILDIDKDFIRGLAYHVALLLDSNFLMIKPNEGNLNLIHLYKESFPNVEIIMPNGGKLKNFDLHSLVMDYVYGKKTSDEVADFIANNSIVTKIGEELLEFKELMRVGFVLSEKRASYFKSNIQVISSMGKKEKGFGFEKKFKTKYSLKREILDNFDSYLKKLYSNKDMKLEHLFFGSKITAYFDVIKNFDTSKVIDYINKEDIKMIKKKLSEAKECAKAEFASYEILKERFITLKRAVYSRAFIMHVSEEELKKIDKKYTENTWFNTTVLGGNLSKKIDLDINCYKNYNYEHYESFANKITIHFSFTFDIRDFIEKVIIDSNNRVEKTAAYR